MENKDDDEDDDRPERRKASGVVPEAMFNFQFGSSMLMELPLPLLPWWARIYPTSSGSGGQRKGKRNGGGVVEGAATRGVWVRG